MDVRPGYKRTEVGVIPEDWDVVVIGDLGRLSSGTTPARALSNRYYSNGTIPWVKTLDLNNSEICNTNERVTDAAIKETSLSVYPIGTVLVAMYGGFVQIGRTGLLRLPAAVNQALTAIQTDRRRLLPSFLLRVLNLRVDYWKKVASSSRKDPNITGSDIRAFPFGLPPTLAEQEVIAAALSDADALIESLEQLVAKKRQLKVGMMQELLTGRRRLPGFSGEWQTHRFDQLFVFIRNASNSRSELSTQGEVAYVHYGDVHTHRSCLLDPHALRTYIRRDRVRSLPRLADGDLLMVDASEDTEAIGKAVEVLGLAGTEAVAGLHTIALRGHKSLLANGFKGYIQYLPGVHDALVRLATGVSVYGITKSGVKAIELAIPKPEEQAAIAAVLADMDAELAALEAKLAKARLVRQGLAHELLTGRVRLT